MISQEAPQPISFQPVNPVTGEPIRVGIPFPPDHIFKNRQARVGVQNQIFVGNASFIPYDADYLEGDGCYVKYAGCKTEDGVMPAPLFPSRCVATADAIYAMNHPKRLFFSVFRFFAEAGWGWKKNFNNILELFISQANLTMGPFYLKDGYYCPIARQVRAFTRAFLLSLGAYEEKADKVAEITACFMEYDNAYRYPVQDALAEADQYALIEDFPGEMARIARIISERMPKNQSQAEKFEKAVKVMRKAWWLPPVRNAIRKGIEAIDFSQCQWEEGEIYHTVWYDGYNVQGKNLEERIELYKNYHGEDEKQWPPRIVMHR